MKEDYKISQSFLDTARKKFRSSIEMSLIRLRDQVAIVPTFLTNYDNRFEITEITKEEYIGLCLLSNFFEEFTPVMKLQLEEMFMRVFPLRLEEKHQLQKYLDQQEDYLLENDTIKLKNKFSFSSRDLYPFLKNNRNARLRLLCKVSLDRAYGKDFMFLLLDAEFIAANELFGILGQKNLNSIVKSLSFRRTFQPKITRVNRKRGYNDHGSMRDETKTVEKSDFTFNDYQNSRDYITDSDHELYSSTLKAFQPTGVELHDTDELKEIYTLSEGGIKRGK